MLGETIETSNNNIKSIISMLDEVNKTLVQKDISMADLIKEKEHLSNLVRLNKYDMDNLENEKNTLKEQCNKLQEEEFRYKNDLKLAQIRLLQSERDLDEIENRISLKYSKQLEDLETKNKLYRKEIENLEKTSISTIDHLTNYVNKDYYKSLNDKYLNLEERLNSRENSVKRLYGDIKSLFSENIDIEKKSHDEYLEEIKIEFKKQINEINLLKLENEKLKKEHKVSNYYESNYSSEELQLKHSLGL